VITLLLLLCASFFAVYHSDSAYSTDEVWSIRTASASVSLELAALKADVHPPLYFLILHPWLHLVGTEERAVRILSGWFYLLSVLALFGLGRQLYGVKTGLLCAVIYLVSPLAILGAQFARMYSLLSLLAILSTWLYLPFTKRGRASHLILVLYVAVNILGTFTHIAFFFLLFAQIVSQVLFYRRLQLQRFLVALALSLLPYLFLWGPILIHQIAISREGTAWVKKPGLAMMTDLLLQYGGAAWLLLPLLFYLYWRRGFEREGIQANPSRHLPLWLFAITLLTPLLISTVKPVFNARLAIVGLHLFALSVGALLGRGANLILPIALIALSAAFLPLVHPAGDRCDSRAVAEYLTLSARDNDIVIFTSLTRLPIDFYLERSRRAPRLFETSFPAEIDSHPGYEGRLNSPELKQALESEARELINRIDTMKPERVFFLHGFHPEVDAILEQQLRERFQVQTEQGLQCDEATYFRKISVYK
jgi:4-amino-4-deoxy-L-arabinose transferase-like glycosyltransferase